MSERLRLAARDPSVVVAADGLLALFNEAGLLNSLDTLAASTVSRLLGESNEVATLAAALAVRGTRFGHVCVNLETLAESVVVDDRDRDAVAALPWPDPADWRAALSASPLVDDGSGQAPLVVAGDRLYLERYYRYEQSLSGLIWHRLSAPDSALPPLSRDLLDRLLVPDGDATTQHSAATRALTGHITVIAGGPGTGKTYTIGMILAAMAADTEHRFPLVGVCAPTGKAAARLGEAISKSGTDIGDPGIATRLATVTPSTIHRLLGWTWGRSRFRHGPNNRLPHDVVIVDEMSMVSLPLAARLLGSVRQEARVILVGDPFQLESIEAGTVLADIVGPATSDVSAAPIRDRVVILDRGHRFQAGSAIDEFADAVRLGESDRAIELLSSSGDQLRWVADPAASDFAPLWDEVVSRRRRVVELALSGQEPTAALAALNEMAVLCAHRRGPTGVSHWSRELEVALDEHFPGLRWGGEWYPGRPVMITRNDYNLDLYNGDIGVTVNTDEGMRAVFDRGGLRRYPLSHLTEHATVHALTIHKSQGSQFEQVVVVLPDDESPLLTRELLYTAVTRAQHRVWLIGTEAVVRAAVGRSVPRASGLASLLNLVPHEVGGRTSDFRLDT